MYSKERRSLCIGEFLDNKLNHKYINIKDTSDFWGYMEQCTMVMEQPNKASVAILQFC